MKINATFLKRITEGSRVEIRTQGALGDKFVYVIPGDLSQPPLKDQDVLMVNKSGDLMSIIAEKGAEAGKIFDVITELHRSIKALNDNNRMEKIMTNLTDITSSFRTTADQSQKFFSDFHSQTSPKLKSSMEKLDNILTKIDHGEGSLGALINDPTLHEQLKAMVGGSPRKKYMKSLIRSSVEKSQPENGE